MSLNLEINDDARGTIVKIEGRLDSDTAPQMRPVYDELLDRRARYIVLDCSRLEYLSSAGLQRMLQLKKLAEANGGRLVISEPTPQVRKVLDIIKAVPVNEVFASQQELDAYLDLMQKSVTDSSDDDVGL